MNKYVLIFCLLVGTLTSKVFSQEYIHTMELPPEVRKNYQNYGSGSCVYMSIGMNGRWLNNSNAASCPWNSDYGPENVGGASPGNVASMAKERNLSLYNVTANNYETMREWFIWAVKTGRYAAIGAGSRHYQTLYGYDDKKKIWYVCNNNSTHKIDEYTEEGFRRLHEASGYWAVFLIGPATPAVADYVPWYK